MDKDFEPELKGSWNEATAAKELIAKYFKRIGDFNYQESKKHQLIFASKILTAISRCANKHLDIYCNIILEIFGDRLRPESSAKYWTLYVDCIRYFHYLLVDKKEYEKAPLIYRHISSYNNKLQNAENSLAYINIYCYHLLLQYSFKSKNQEQALREATDVVDNLTILFNDILDTNKKQNFQYPDVLKRTISWLLPQNRACTIYQFLKNLPEENVKQMFQALFKLYGHKTMEVIPNVDDVQEHAKCIIEIVHTLLQVDIIDKMQLQLSILLMGHCRTECRLQTNKPIAETFLLLYDYLKLLCAQKSTTDFPHIYSTCCERFKELFEKYSKSVMNQTWFGAVLVFIFYLHSQLQNKSTFCCFWSQMNKPECFKALFQFFVELMKLAPCISSDTKLVTINCCTSVRKHVILSFAQISLTAFMFYCQNVNVEYENELDMENADGNLPDWYKEMIQNNLILILNHAFKIIDKMDCITSDSQEIDIILTRFKQVTLSCRTYKQAATCISICEMFLKIKTKIGSREWPLLLRRLYKTVTQHATEDLHIGREIQMCYIASMLHTENQIDISQIRTQISIFYATETTSTQQNEGQQQEQQQHDHCLLYLHHTSNSLLKPHLEPPRKKLLHWLESQHILKYLKSNLALLHSVLKSSQSHYDFVLITKLGKLQNYAMAKISSLYNALKSKEDASVLSRLEKLTLGHVCSMLLNEMDVNQTFNIDSKDLSEEQLDNLFMRKEMSSITIYNDLKRFKLAWEAFKAFEYFYEKFDSETISMDDAIIDWESILDDLGGLALCLQLSGYMEHSSQAWLLHYKYSRLIQDDFSALRGLSFFCEYFDHFSRNFNEMILEDEIHKNFPAIIQLLENLGNLQRKSYQNYVLLAVLQIAHYYARSSRFSFAQMLLQYVELKHSEITERQGRYDIIMATMEAIKFRLLWKNFDHRNATAEEKALRTKAENLLLHRCLLHEVEETIDRFHNFSFICNGDGVLYTILIINLVQEFAECTANRLCDNFIVGLFIATCKCTLMMRLALRFVQVMSMWMWMNLQMEYVERAQVKLKLIEYVMGMKSLKELNKKSTKSLTDIKSSTLLQTGYAEFLTPNRHNPGMEAIRKLAKVQLSPIKADKLELSPSHQNSDLKRYFQFNIDTKLLPQNEQIQWIFFMVGCLHARLYFLVEEYDQLETFYENGTKWLQMRQNCFNMNYHKNLKLMSFQHYANFLRVRRQYDKALQCLQYGMELCENNNFHIDAAYSANFQLQILAIQKEMSHSNDLKFKFPTHSRRALQFNTSPDNEQQKTPPKSELNEKISEHVVASGGCSSSKKIKTQSVLDLGDSNHTCSSSSSLGLKSGKAKPKFEICEDSFEIIEISENVHNVILADDKKSMKRTRMAKENEQLYKTPKVVRKATRSKTTAAKLPVKNKRPANIPQFHIDLADSPPWTLTSLDTKENFISNELVAKMENLEIKSCKKTKKICATEIKTKNTKNRDKPNSIRESPPIVIVLEDSPCALKPNQTESANEPKSHNTGAKTEDKSSNGQSRSEDNLASSSRSRRQNRIMLKTDSEGTLQNKTPSKCSKTSTPIVTRRRQKNLV